MAGLPIPAKRKKENSRLYKLFCKATKQLCSDLGIDYDQVKKERREYGGRSSYGAYGFGCKYPLTFHVMLEQIERADHPLLSVWVQIPYGEGCAPFELGDYDIPELKRHGDYLVHWVEYAVHKFRLEHEPVNLRSRFAGATIRVYGVDADPDLTLVEMRIFIMGIKKIPNYQVTIYRFRHIDPDTGYKSFSYGFSVALRGLLDPFWIFFHGVGGTHPGGINRHIKPIETMTKTIRGSVQEQLDIEYDVLHKYLLEHAVSFDPRHSDELLPDSNEVVLKIFHAEVEKHARDPLNQGRYFDSVDECCKAFERYVAKQFKSDKHGQTLMAHVFTLGKGIYLAQDSETETEKNQREGLMYLCMGLMRHIRNPLEHETQLELPMGEQDALSALSFISYLFKKVENLLANEKYTLVSNNSSVSESNKQSPDSGELP